MPGLRALRWQFALLYASAAAVIIALVGGGAYLALARYFEQVTDLALRHKMAHEFYSLNAPLPADLASADADWSILRARGSRAADSSRMLTTEEAAQIAQAVRGSSARRVNLEDQRYYEVEMEDGSEVYLDAYSGQIIGLEVKGGEAAERSASLALSAGSPTGAFEAELASIFVLPLDAQGRILFNPNPAALPVIVDREALAAALKQGFDLRTVTMRDGQRVRLLTYRLTRSDGPAALQLGRVLTDQTSALNQLLLGLLTFGVIGAVAVGVVGWWQAGRAIRPAEEAWSRQMRFIANASHELRAPLALIRASAEVALREVENADQHALLSDVVSEADHMRRLVDDLLTLSRLDGGSLALHRQSLALVDFLAHFLRKVERLGEERNVHIALSKASGNVWADPDRLHQVLLILLDNALRYTPAGGSITLAAEPVGKMVRLSVHDTGCGIAPEQLPHVFERFYRADQARARAGEHSNAGLGLSIAKGLVEAHGGKIGIESALNVGTTVWFTLPAAT